MHRIMSFGIFLEKKAFFGKIYIFYSKNEKSGAFIESATKACTTV